MGLVQRELERAGLGTVSITLARPVTEQVRVPRAYFVRYPFGHPFGEPDAPAQQRQILSDALGLLESAREPGIIVDSPYRWRRDTFV